MEISYDTSVWNIFTVVLKGRFDISLQVMCGENVTIYLHIAYTKDSFAACLSHFEQSNASFLFFFLFVMSIWWAPWRHWLLKAGQTSTKWILSVTIPALTDIQVNYWKTYFSRHLFGTIDPSIWIIIIQIWRSHLKLVRDPRGGIFRNFAKLS